MNSFYKVVKKDKKVYSKSKIIGKVKMFKVNEISNKYNFYVTDKSIQIKRSL